MRGWLVAGLLFHSVCLSATERVISLAPFLTDMVIMLDATEQLVGVLDDGQLPPELDHVPRVGGHQSLSLELIVEQKPELVLAWDSGNPPALLSRLESWGIRVLRFDPKDLESIATTVERLGEALHASERAANLNHSYTTALSQLAVPVDAHDCQFGHGDGQFEAAATCAAGVDVQHTGAFGNRGFVRMPRDHHVRTDVDRIDG